MNTNPNANANANANLMACAQKLMAAKQLELEAIMLLVPDQTRGHLEVIGREIKSLFVEALCPTQSSQSTKESKINKVTID